MTFPSSSTIYTSSLGAFGGPKVLTPPPYVSPIEVLLGQVDSGEAEFEVVCRDPCDWLLDIELRGDGDMLR